ncbi:MAG: hypothetical protein K6G26_04880 [Lachnospiraceae bacterium]|nr:hypothetical protein [Lachnospiraceae bacterium]
MHYNNMKFIKKFAACIITIIMLFSVIFSSFYISLEMHHDCCGDGCPICSFIQECEHTLNLIGDGLIILFATIIPLAVLYRIMPFFSFELSDITPVSNKVRLNN